MLYMMILAAVPTVCLAVVSIFIVVKKPVNDRDMVISMFNTLMQAYEVSRVHNAKAWAMEGNQEEYIPLDQEQPLEPGVE